MGKLANEIYGVDFDKIDVKKNPELYKVGRGEEGVLSFKPYKTEIGQYWKFSTPEIAKQSAEKVYSMFLEYLRKDDFPGADMASKFIKMGYTRSMRYYHHKSGHKYVGAVPKDKKGQSGAHGRDEAPLDLDPEKKKSAMMFKKYYDKILDNKQYIKRRDAWKEKYG